MDGVIKDFNDKSNGKGGTIKLFKEKDNNKRWGGYTSISWDSSHYHKSDSKSFLF